MAHLRKRLPAEGVAHKRRRQLHRLGAPVLRFRRFPARRLAPTSGMRVPRSTAVAAKIVHPERVVVALAGDGDFLMTGQELATAVHATSPWSRSSSTTACTERSACTRSGTIRVVSLAPTSSIPTSPRSPGPTALRGDRRADGRVSGRVRGGARQRPAALLELLVDPEALTPRQTLSEIREAASDARKECPSNRGFLPRSGATMIRA